MWLAPLPAAVPLLAAAFLAAAGKWLAWRTASLLAILTSFFTAAICLALLLEARSQPFVYWFGNWTPRNGGVVGISFVIDSMGAGMAALASLLVTAALIFSWRYFDTVGTLYHVLMLVFLGAMCGFSLTGDLFNLFVFFELMSASAFALCGYKSESPASLQGALNFAVTNTIGGFLILSGTALLYGRTGALNMAQIGRALEPPADGLIVAAFVFILCGFFVKAAVVPFHFWLDDAHAIAPTPVCTLFSGVMVELGLYGIARVYWTVFEGALGPQTAVLRNVLIGMGVMTSLLGALMCFVQRHLKRMLAFSTISHMGLLVIGFALLTPRALAGAALYLLGHAMVKPSLFFCVGILLHRYGSVDEIELGGRGRTLRLTGVVFTWAALGLAGAPAFITFLGTKLMEESAVELGYAWLKLVPFGVAMLTSATVLRAAGRVFIGWGADETQFLGEAPKIEEPRETVREYHRAPAVMIFPPLVLGLMGMLFTFVPGLASAVDLAAGQMVDRSAYASRVLDGISVIAPSVPAREKTFAGGVSALGPITGAALLALFTLFRGKVPFRFRIVPNFVVTAVNALRLLHSGRVGDYVVWLTLGVGVLGALLGFLMASRFQLSWPL
jgi:multicomponent Na+:H+ antiporter subunit D